MIASFTTPSIEARTKRDWSFSGVTCSSGGRLPASCFSAARTCEMIVSVEALPDFRIVRREARCPLTRTMFVCGALPSRTCATSLMKTTAPLRDRIGRSFNPSIVPGALLVSTAYSNWPIFAVPAGRIRFCALIALTTSEAERPRDCSAWRSRSTWICRGLPPYG